eukprot:EC124024.1.p1 GENE.EC124024.1~~EC124024.1.p1  ORF type:complete len:142 (+),score=16.61 EC124024.1:126-551(+)
MATRVHESGVLNAALEDVWPLIRPLTFSWLSTVTNVDVTGGLAEVGGIRTIKYKDGTTQKVKILEISDAEYGVTYELIESDPPALILSAIHTIRLRRITKTRATFVEWVSDHSNDADQQVLQDSKFKKLEAFDDLAQALAK